MEIAAQHEGAVLFHIAPIEAEEGMLGPEVADLQNAIHLCVQAGSTVGECQFGFGQRQVCQLLSLVEVGQPIEGFLLGVR